MEKTSPGPQTPVPARAADREVYVSITGLQLKGRRHMLRFWWHAIRSLRQARKAPGNILVEVRMIDGVHHTLTVWVDEGAMRRYLVSGAHLQAMKSFHGIATGKTFGFTTRDVPDWSRVRALWESEGSTVVPRARTHRSRRSS